MYSFDAYEAYPFNFIFSYTHIPASMHYPPPTAHCVHIMFALSNREVYFTMTKIQLSAIIAPIFFIEKSLTKFTRERDLD